MKKPTFPDWIKAFATTWIGPKLGTVLAVLPLAGIIISTAIALHPESDKSQAGALDAPVAAEVRDAAKPSAMAAANTNSGLQTADGDGLKKAGDADDPSKSALNGMVKLVTKSTGPWQVVIYAVSAGWWLLTMLANAYARYRKPTPWIFKVSQMGATASALFGFTAGMLVVPLALCWAVMLQVPGGTGLMPQLVLVTAGYVYICSTIHWAGYNATELPNAILYVLELPADARSEKDDAELLRKVREQVDGAPWISAPEFLAQSDDGRAALILPIRYPVAKWRNEEAQALLTRLQKVEQCWRDGKILMHSKVVPSAFTGKVAPRLKATPKPVA